MGVLGTLAEATQAITIGATLTNFAWILPTKPVGWLISTTLGDKGPKLLIKHGTRPVKERQALRKGDPMTYEDGKDMLYRFMESTDPATGQPLDTPTLIKVNYPCSQACMYPLTIAIAELHFHNVSRVYGPMVQLQNLLLRLYIFHSQLSGRRHDQVIHGSFPEICLRASTDARAPAERDG